MIKDEENRKLAEQEQKDEQRLRTEFNNQLSKINDETLNNKYKYKRPSKLDPQFIQSQFSIENPNDEASNGNCALESSDKVADHINLNKTISLNELKVISNNFLTIVEINVIIDYMEYQINQAINASALSQLLIIIWSQIYLILLSKFLEIMIILIEHQNIY